MIACDPTTTASSGWVVASSEARVCSGEESARACKRIASFWIPARSRRSRLSSRSTHGLSRPSRPEREIAEQLNGAGILGEDEHLGHGPLFIRCLRTPNTSAPTFTTSSAIQKVHSESVALAVVLVRSTRPRMRFPIQHGESSSTFKFFKSYFEI